MNKAQKQVEEFMRVMGQNVPNHITLKTYPGELRHELIHEEVDEFEEAMFNSDQVEMIDALCDILYVTYGAASAMGVDLEPFFDEVQRSNMTKVGLDGKVLKRDDGKVLKPSTYSAPDLRGILDKMLEYQRRFGNV